MTDWTRVGTGGGGAPICFLTLLILLVPLFVEFSLWRPLKWVCPLEMGRVGMTSGEDGQVNFNLFAPSF